MTEKDLRAILEHLNLIKPSEPIPAVFVKQAE